MRRGQRRWTLWWTRAPTAPSPCWRQGLCARRAPLCAPTSPVGCPPGAPSAPPDVRWPDSDVRLVHAFWRRSCPGCHVSLHGTPQCPTGSELHRRPSSATGVTLSSEELGALLMPSARLPHIVKGRPCHAGTGLAAVYTFTDVPMALAGARTALRSGCPPQLRSLRVMYLHLPCRRHRLGGI